MTVPSTVNRNDYVGNGATTVYPYTYQIFNQTHLEVWVQSLSGSVVKLTLTTDYTVSGVGLSGGGNVTLVTPLVSGYLLAVKLVLPITQLTDLRNQGQFFPEVHERVFDRGIRIDQQLADQYARGLKLPETEVGSVVKTTIPVLSQRASKLLGFDELGNPAAMSFSISTDIHVNNIAALRLVSGDGSYYAITKGYYTSGDGGGNSFYWDGTSSATDNGGTIIKPTLVSGAGRWLAVSSTRASFEQFGSKGDDSTDNTAFLQSAINACNYVYVENGVHLSGALTISTAKTITSKSITSGLKLRASANTELLTISSDNVSILDMLIDGNKTNQSGTSRTINTTHGYNNIRIMRNRIKNAYSEGVRVQGAFNVMIKDNHIENCHQTGNQSAIVVRNETGSSKSVRIISNYIDQQSSSNGCIKIQSAHATYRATDVIISQNTCLMGDPTIDGALGIECFTLSGGEMMNVTIANNVVECTGTGTVSGNPSNYYAYGISIGGQSTTDGFGVKGCTISGNNIRNCRRIGLEIIGRRITATGNTLEDSAEISINADDVASGMYAISVVGNTLYNTGGFGTFYGGIRIRAITQSLYGLTITGNTIYKTSGATTTEDIIFVQGGNGTGANTGELFDVIINDNNLSGISRYGVHLQSDTSIHNAQIKNNSFRFDTAATTGTGILSNARAVNGLSIVGNTFRGVGAQNTDGITLNGLGTALSVKVQGNTLDVCRNGILTSGSCNTLNVSDNIVKLSSGVGITIGNSPTNVVYDNNLFVTNGTNESLSTTIVYSMASIIQGLTIGANKNIASGAITITGSSHIVDTEAAAATDDLDTINGASFAGQELLLKSAVTGRTVVLKDATGNLRLAGDFSLDHIQDTIRLHWNGAQWCEISRSNNT